MIGNQMSPTLQELRMTLLFPSSVLDLQGARTSSRRPEATDTPSLADTDRQINAVYPSRSHRAPTITYLVKVAPFEMSRHPVPMVPLLLPPWHSEAVRARVITGRRVQLRKKK
jgi:hypothetical protein